MHDTPNTINFQPYIDLLKKWYWLILVTGLVFGLLAYGTSADTQPIYRASTTLLINGPHNSGVSTTSRPDYSELLYVQRLAQTYASLMTGRQIRNEVIDRIGIAPSEFSSQVSDIAVAPVEDTQLLIVKVTGHSPELVALVANTLPEVFIEELQSIALKRYADSKGSLQEELQKIDEKISELEGQLSERGRLTSEQQELARSRLETILSQYQSNYVDLLDRFESIRLSEAQATSNIFVTDPAIPPSKPIGPPILTNILLSAVIGALIPLIFISFLGYLDNNIGTPDRLRRRFNQPVLGSISEHRLSKDFNRNASGINLVTVSHPRDQISEEYRILRTGVLSAARDKNIKTIAVTSAIANEGKSTTAANLAVVMSQVGMSVALVDADMRRPTLHKLFSQAAQPGLANTLGDPVRLHLPYEIHHLLPRLTITPCGTLPMNPGELLGSNKMFELIENLKQKVDLVIFDTPPLLSVADTQILSGYVDSVLLVVGADTNPKQIATSLEALQTVNSKILGLLLNRTMHIKSSTYDDYAYHIPSPQVDPSRYLPDSSPNVNLNGMSTEREKSDWS